MSCADRGRDAVLGSFHWFNRAAVAAHTDYPGQDLDQLRIFLAALAASSRNLLPVIGVVILFQWLVMREMPTGVWTVLAGLLLVAVGIALFLRGLELSVFPIGRSLSDAFAQRGVLGWLLAFGFCLGFAAVIAEPALIAVAHKAEVVSDGRIQAWLLRVLAAASVGAVMALGILRALLNHPVLWYLVGGYLLLVLVTYVTPAEITGLAFDAGAVSANMVTVPLITALGMGLMASVRGHKVLSAGFGLVALAVMAPRLTVQIYGIVVYSVDPGVLAGYMPEVIAETATAPSGQAQSIMSNMFSVMVNLLPIVAVILAFQFLVIRMPLLHVRRLVVGFVLLLLGLFAFTEGLRLGLFPIGEHLASGLSRPGGVLYLYLFVFLLGFAATWVEPALMAVIRHASQLDPARLRPPLIRSLVALGVGAGLFLGALRLTYGWGLDHVLAATLVLLCALALLAPRELVGFAFALGGIATSDVNVPVITALGVGLAVAIGSDDVMLEGFGLVALASLYVIVAVLLYAIVVQRIQRHGEAP
jgi:hypothetical protein